MRQIAFGSVTVKAILARECTPLGCAVMCKQFFVSASSAFSAVNLFPLNAYNR